MHFKSFIFYLTLIVLLKRSCGQDEYDESDFEISDEEVPTTPIPSVKKGEISEKSTIYETEKISADKGSNVVLECKPENEKAVWLIKPAFELIITTASDGTASLSIFNVMHDRTYECRRSDNIVRRFVLTINGSHATIASNSDYVRNGSNIRISCLIRSTAPVTTAYLRLNNVHTAHKYVANWESKRRICANDDYNRTDCFEETTFKFNVDVTESGVYTCAYDDVESIGHVVEVLDTEPIIYEATKVCALKYVQRKVVQFAIEALEKHGLDKDAATDIREKCAVEFKRFKGWNCIIGKENFKHSLSPAVNGDEYASFKFSLGSIFVAVFQKRLN